MKTQYLLPRYEEKRCVVCNQNYLQLRGDITSQRPLQNGIRRRGCKTCSSKCSRKYVAYPQKLKKQINENY